MLSHAHNIDGRYIMSKRGLRGLTLIELLIAVAILGVLGTVIVAYMSGTKDFSAIATQYADEFAQNMGWEVIGKSCTGSDTDWDGYISCTISISNNGVKEIHQLQCGGGRSGGIKTSGCKLALPSTHVNMH